MQKKLLNQLIFDLLELKRLKEELQEYSNTQELIEQFNHRIKDIKLSINELKNLPFEIFTEEYQDYLTELPISNLYIIETTESLLEEENIENS